MLKTIRTKASPRWIMLAMFDECSSCQGEPDRKAFAGNWDCISATRDPVNLNPCNFDQRIGIGIGRPQTCTLIYIYIYSNYMYIHRYDVEHCETCFCFSALLAMMSFISLWRGSHMSATGMPAWWWTSVRHQWLSSYFMESSVGVLGGSWRDMMQQKSVPWLRTKRT